jgi:L-aspartate oxidase
MERYLTSLNLNTVPKLDCDVLVLGGGVAGLSAALAAAGAGASILVLVKGRPERCATYEAQGGIAAALAEPGCEGHVRDTLEAGAGLCDEEAVRVLACEGIPRVEKLVEQGVSFDRADGELALTLEGGHSERRILHASGDATGKALHEALAARVASTEGIQLFEDQFAIDLLHHNGRVHGALCLDSRYGRPLRIDAGAVVLATGGGGRVYRETTNPETSTGDGYAMAFRAGATLADLEFVQFHPTTLYLPGAPRFLISEAVRGEGAYLRRLDGTRFMPEEHPQAELAPRDIVSQAILRHMHATETSHVLLDLRHLDPERVRGRFPTICGLCAEYGLDIARDCIPVRPACHYMMGGVQTGVDGQTNVPGLFACGEVACTGVHGANRLASNSLLEGLVFGHRAGLSATQAAAETPARPVRQAMRPPASARTVPLDIDDVMRSLRALTWRDLGVYRSEEQLAHAERTIGFWQQYVLAEEFTAPHGFEVQNMLTVAMLIARAARTRTESRGAHQRFDYPGTDDERWKRRITLSAADF